VTLSGTATDGTLGLEAIKAEGGIMIAQDDSARYDSMPRSAVAAGCVDFVLSPQDIAKETRPHCEHPYVAGQPPEPPIAAVDDRAAATEHEDDATPRHQADTRRRVREPDRRAPKLKRGAVKRETIATRKFFFSCATIAALIFRCTNPPPSSGVLPAAWC
jgi:two-component system CheB/CheR fusion protein